MHRILTSERKIETKHAEEETKHIWNMCNVAKTFSKINKQI